MKILTQSTMYRILLPAIFSLLSFSGLHAQLEKVIHHTFDPGDAAAIQIQLMEEYELLPWAGNQILTETYIELYSAAPHVLRFFVEEKGRYQITVMNEEGTLHLMSADQERQPILYRSQECTEFVRTKIYVPDNYESVGEGMLKRRE